MAAQGGRWLLYRALALLLLSRLEAGIEGPCLFCFALSGSQAAIYNKLFVRLNNGLLNSQDSISVNKTVAQVVSEFKAANKLNANQVRMDDDAWG